MTLRLDQERETRLRQLATEENQSMHSVIVAAIDEYLDGHDGRKFADLAEEIVERHAALLDRLAQ